MLISASFKDIFQQNLNVQKGIFIEICYCYITYYYNVAVYILVQSEEYPLI